MTSSLSHSAYERIRAGLVRGEYTDRTRISEPGLARELGIGRTPVREAVQRLISEGLLEQQPKSGTFIVQPTRKDLDEILQLRVLLEPYVAGEAAASKDRRFVRTLKKLVDEMREYLRLSQAAKDDDELDELLRKNVASDLAFHETLLAAAGNTRIRRIISDGRILTQALAFPRDSVHGVLFTMQTSFSEHEAIYNAVREGNKKASEKAMTTHLKRVHKGLLEYFDCFKAGE